MYKRQIEYDCVDPLQMDQTLEFLDFPGLYGAGQFNGSSGYEEAAAQGLVAGINEMCIRDRLRYCHYYFYYFGKDIDVPFFHKAAKIDGR